MHYRIREKLAQTLDCNLLVVTSNHLILCLEKRLQSVSFAGVIEREWILDSSITYIKVAGGPAGKECLITGSLNNSSLVSNNLKSHKKDVNRDSHIASSPISQSSFFKGVRCLILASPQRKLRRYIEFL